MLGITMADKNFPKYRLIQPKNSKETVRIFRIVIENTAYLIIPLLYITY